MGRFGVPLRGRRWLRAGLAAVIAVTAALVTVVHDGTPAAAAPGPGVSCPPVPIWANTVNTLYQISSTGSVISTAPLDRAYGDIAFSADGSTLYGITGGATLSAAPILWKINPQTGASTQMPGDHRPAGHDQEPER